jgi:hypothetical protein
LGRHPDRGGGRDGDRRREAGGCLVKDPPVQAGVRGFAPDGSVADCRATLRRVRNRTVCICESGGRPVLRRAFLRARRLDFARGPSPKRRTTIEFAAKQPPALGALCRSSVVEGLVSACRPANGSDHAGAGPRRADDGAA